MDVLCFGEILFDRIEGEAFLGGAPMNFAAHSAKLGARSFILSRVGEDELGERAVREAEKLGVETKFIQTDKDLPTGTVDVQLDQGSPAYVIHEDVAFDRINLEEFIIHYTVAEFDFIYFGTLAQRDEVSRSTLWQLTEDIEFPEVFFDVNLRQDYYTPEIIHVSLHKATIFKLNDEEAEVLSEMLFGRQMTLREFCDAVAADFMLRIIIVTRGGEGCLVWQDGEVQEVPGVDTKVNDTVGAGDAFSAAFMYFYLKSGNARKAAEKANHLGAFVAGARGAVPEYSDDLRLALFDGEPT